MYHVIVTMQDFKLSMGRCAQRPQNPVHPVRQTPDVCPVIEQDVKSWGPSHSSYQALAFAFISCDAQSTTAVWNSSKCIYDKLCVKERAETQDSAWTRGMWRNRGEEGSFQFEQKSDCSQKRLRKEEQRCLLGECDLQVTLEKYQWCQNKCIQ